MTCQPITIAVAPDSFKGSLTAREAADCIARGLKRVLANVSVRKIPMADGGEGTVRAIVDSTGGRFVTRKVRGPLGKPVKAEFGITGDGRTAVIEMAAASGLGLLTPGERNPLLTSTFGTGELMRHALQLGVSRILVGIGGSATNDCGTGMARALGVRFLDRNHREVAEGGGALGDVARIDVSGRDDRLDRVRVEVACDVDNPLTGPRGASRVYGPQKGATADMVRRLDANLKHLARLVLEQLRADILRTPGSGAAGGLGGGLIAFAGGRLRPGIEIVVESVKLERRLKGCDLVVTGEGRMDGQTVFGKTPAGVARVAGRLGLPVVAISGCVGTGASQVHAVGIDAYVSALQESMDESELPKRGPAMLEDCAEQVARLLSLDFRGRTELRRRRPPDG